VTCTSLVFVVVVVVVVVFTHNLSQNQLSKYRSAMDNHSTISKDTLSIFLDSASRIGNKKIEDALLQILIVLYSDSEFRKISCDRMLRIHGKLALDYGRGVGTKKSSMFQCNVQILTTPSLVQAHLNKHPNAIYTAMWSLAGILYRSSGKTDQDMSLSIRAPYVIYSSFLFTLHSCRKLFNILFGFRYFTQKINVWHEERVVDVRTRSMRAKRWGYVTYVSIKISICVCVCVDVGAQSARTPTLSLSLSLFPHTHIRVRLALLDSLDTHAHTHRHDLTYMLRCEGASISTVKRIIQDPNWSDLFVNMILRRVQGMNSFKRKFGAHVLHSDMYWMTSFELELKIMELVNLLFKDLPSDHKSVRLHSLLYRATHLLTHSLTHSPNSINILRYKNLLVISLAP